MENWIGKHLSNILIIIVVILVMTLAYFLTALYFNIKDRQEFEKLKDMRRKRREILRNRRAKLDKKAEPHKDSLLPENKKNTGNSFASKHDTDKQ